MDNTFDSFGLDCFECGPEFGVSWSHDNHILILGKQSVLLVTPSNVPGGSIKRAKWATTAPIQSAKFSNVKVDGYHRVAILDERGWITVYGPRLDPSLNAWALVSSMGMDASCFDWCNDTIIYGQKNGRILKGDTILHERKNRIPIVIKVVSNSLIVGWDDGLVEMVNPSQSPSGITTLCDDGCWGVGPIVSADLFSKVNRIYFNTGNCWEVPVLSPIVGLTSTLAITRDGKLFNLTSRDAIISPMRLERVYGAAEAPAGGLVAFTGMCKGQSTLVIMQIG